MYVLIFFNYFRCSKLINSEIFKKGLRNNWFEPQGQKVIIYQEKDEATGSMTQ